MGCLCLQDCREGVGRQQAWGSFGHIKRVLECPVCPMPDNLQGTLGATGDLPSHLSYPTKESRRGSVLGLECPPPALHGCSQLHAHVCLHREQAGCI